MVIEKKEFKGKSYLVNVPVRVVIWSRPDCLKMQFDVIKQALPSIIFLVSDGGRDEAEHNLILKNREMILKEIDWSCDVYTLFFNQNVGMYKIAEISNKYIWDHVDRCIFLEDDYVPSVSLFSFCKEMLDKYENDFRVLSICCVNILGINKKTEDDYFFAKQGMLWCNARWRNRQSDFIDFSYVDNKYVMDCMVRNGIKKDSPLIYKRMIKNGNDKTVHKPFSQHEFLSQSMPYLQNQLIIIPKKNLITCYGDVSGAHAGDLKYMPPFRRKLFRMKRYELSNTIKHPSFMVPDELYSKEFIKSVISERKLYFFFWRIIVLFKKLFCIY